MKKRTTVGLVVVNAVMLAVLTLNPLEARADDAAKRDQMCQAHRDGNGNIMDYHDAGCSLSPTDTCGSSRCRDMVVS